MPSSEKERSDNGVVVSFRELNEDTIQVYLGNVQNQSPPEKRPWLDKGLVTFKDYKISAIENMALSGEN